jgi:hypothetical protein
MTLPPVDGRYYIYSVQEIDIMPEATDSMPIEYTYYFFRQLISFTVDIAHVEN